MTYKAFSIIQNYSDQLHSDDHTELPDTFILKMILIYPEHKTFYQLFIISNYNDFVISCQS